MSKSNYSSETLAPIAIFAYKRPEKLKKLIHSLKWCEESKYSSLYVFVDHPSSKFELSSHKSMKQFISEIDGFRNIQVFYRNEHLGLAKNITQGISQVLEFNEMIIVLEEDLVVSSYFLKYMNSALRKYDNCAKVFHISAHCDFTHRKIDKPFYFTRKMDCWGWATWKDRWLHFQKNPEEMLQTYSLETVKRFNFDGTYQLWDQVENNALGLLNTWAVFWQASINVHSGVCLTPNKPFAINTGQDGSGQHGVWSRETKKMSTTFDSSHLPEEIIDYTSWVIEKSRNLSTKEKVVRTIKQAITRIIIGIRKRVWHIRN